MTDSGGWRVNATRYLYDSRWFALRQDDITLPNGEDIVYTFVDHPGYAMVLPVTRDGIAIMVDVYRHPLKLTSFECPAGGLDGKTPELTARSELEEETGYLAGELVPLGSYFGGPGSSNERFHLFLALDVEEGGVIAHEATEQIEVRRLPFRKLYDMASTGQLDGGPTALCILLAAATGRVPGAKRC